MEPIKKGDIFEYVKGDHRCYEGGVGSIGVVAKDWDGKNDTLSVKWIIPLNEWGAPKHANGSQISRLNARILKPEEISHVERE